MNIYLAAASSERALAASFMRRLEAAGHSIAMDWTVDMDERAEAGLSDADLTDDERETYARADLEAVEVCDLLWLLAPEGTSIGAWIEFGHALASLKATVVSGPHGRTIFSTLANERFATHEEAFAAICEPAPSYCLVTGCGRAAVYRSARRVSGPPGWCAEHALPNDVEVSER